MISLYHNQETGSYRIASDTRRTKACKSVHLAVEEWNRFTMLGVLILSAYDTKCIATAEDIDDLIYNYPELFI